MWVSSLECVRHFVATNTHDESSGDDDESAVIQLQMHAVIGDLPAHNFVTERTGNYPLCLFVHVGSNRSAPGEVVPPLVRGRFERVFLLGLKILRASTAPVCHSARIHGRLA